MTAWAVDIGGTKIAASVVHDDGTIDGEPVVLPTAAKAGAQAVLTQVIEVLGTFSPAGIDRIGICSAGVVDAREGRVVGATDHIRDWAGTDLAGPIEKHFALPTTAIGDGHAFALGELTWGQAVGCDTALVVAVGTGVGGSFVRQGAPWQGSHWAAGHFGHVLAPEATGLHCPCGRVGHLEAIGSGPGMVRWYHDNGGDMTVNSVKLLVERTPTDAGAADAIRLGARAVGGVIAGLANALDPEIVVVAGGVSQAGPLWEDAMRGALTSTLIETLEELPLKIADPGDWSALRGAAQFSAAVQEEK